MRTKINEKNDEFLEKLLKEDTNTNLIISQNNNKKEQEDDANIIKLKDFKMEEFIKRINGNFILEK